MADLAPDDEEGDALEVPSEPSSIFDLAEESGAEAKNDGAASPDDLDMDLALTLADSPDASAEPEPEEGGFGLGDELGMDLVDSPADLAPDSGEEGTFDFGDMGTLELEESEPEEEEEASLSFGGGMEMEQPLADSMDFASGGVEPGDGGLELESPMSDFGSDSPPAWMEPESAGGADDDDPDALTFAQPGQTEDPASAQSEGEQHEPERPERRERPEPRTRPSPPKRRRNLNLAPILGGVAAVAVIGGGGFFGWKALSSGSGGSDPDDAVPSLPAVTIPDIPAELLPVMRDLAEAALADMIAELRGMQGEFDLAPEPRNDWLSGAYLGTASQFPDVEQYWLGIEALVDRVREVDTQVFHDMYVAQVEAAGIAADTAAMLIERADSGFLASREGRFEAYNQMDDLINAALDLHLFLVDNEADITYEPAAGGISRDPVLEAIPSSSVLGDEMWGMVDNITDALDDLGTLDRVTTDRLFGVLFDRIRVAGVR